jgi:hypothetical protein
MIIDQNSIFTFKSECHSPITINQYRPIPTNAYLGYQIVDEDSKLEPAYRFHSVHCLKLLTVFATFSHGELEPFYQFILIVGQLWGK